MNKFSIIVALIAAFPPTLVAFIGWQSNKKAVHEVHLSLNSRLDELLKSEKSVSKTEGIEQGRAETK